MNRENKNPSYRQVSERRQVRSNQGVSPAQFPTHTHHTASRRNGSFQQSANVARQGYLSTEELVRVRKKRTRGKRRKVALIIVGIILILLLVGGIALALYLHNLDSTIRVADQQQAEDLQSVLTTTDSSIPSEAEGVFYTLVLGSDARAEGQSARSDTMILVRVNPSTKLITMVSIPRDTQVEIEGHGTQKINAAYQYGGPAGAVDAVEKLAHVNITHYAEVHFDGLVNLVDGLGGVWVNVPVPNDQLPGTNTDIHIPAGEQRMNGETALAFARERFGYARGDFQRAENQRILMRAIINQVLSKPAYELPGAITSVASCITTDMVTTDLIALAQQFGNPSDITFYSAVMPVDNVIIDEEYYDIIDQDTWDKMMVLVRDDKDPSTIVTDNTDASSSVIVNDNAAGVGVVEPPA